MPPYIDYSGRSAAPGYITEDTDVEPLVGLELHVERKGVRLEHAGRYERLAGGVAFKVSISYVGELLRELRTLRTGGYLHGKARLVVRGFVSHAPKKHSVAVRIGEVHVHRVLNQRRVDVWPLHLPYAVHAWRSAHGLTS